jgi:cytochrome c peroxidase
MDEKLVDDMFTEMEWAKIQSFTPLPSVPPSPTNRYADDDRAAAFGQAWFFEKRYSGAITYVHASSEGTDGQAGMFSCTSCHDPTRWFMDTRSQPRNLSVGAGHLTKRNAPSMVNVSYYEWGGWAGAQDQFWKQGANAPETPDVNGDRLAVAHVVYDYYRDAYNALFDPDLDPALDPSSPDRARFPDHGKPGVAAFDAMTAEDKLHVNTILANVGKAFEAYERRLTSGDAPFDRYVAGEFTAMSTSAKRGLKLFIGKAGCDGCHKDQTFTDQQFHNTAVMQAVADKGRWEDTGKFLGNQFNGASIFSDDVTAGQEKIAGITDRDDNNLGLFRTKSLRQVAETGPYFHDGSVDSLEAVVRHYNIGGATSGYLGTKDDLMEPLNLNDGEVADIVQFMKMLTGKEVAAELMIDTSPR